MPVVRHHDGRHAARLLNGTQVGADRGARPRVQGADVSRSEAVTPELTEKALLAVTLPESAWRTWGAA